MVAQTDAFNPAQYLDTPAAVYRFLNEALQTKDIRFIRSAFGIVAESKGVEAIAQHTNLNGVQRCLDVSQQTEPSLATILSALDALQADLIIDTHSH